MCRSFCDLDDCVARTWPVHYGCYRRMTGPPTISESQAACRGVAQDRRTSQMYRLERAEGGGIIAPRRSSSAHLHRPWRATAYPRGRGLGSDETIFRIDEKLRKQLPPYDGANKDKGASWILLQRSWLWSVLACSRPTPWTHCAPTSPPPSGRLDTPLRRALAFRSGRPGDLWAA